MDAARPGLVPFDRSSRSYHQRWMILGVLCLSLLVIIVDNSILNVAIPTLVRDLHATNSQLQWMVDSYTLVFAGLLLTAGSLGDRFGRRGALQFGMVVFGLVGAQMGWVLRPFVGHPKADFTFFRERKENFFQAVVTKVGELFEWDSKGGRR